MSARPAGKTDAKSVHSILSGRHSTMRALAEGSARLEGLSAEVDKFLPAPLNRHCRVANLANGILVIHADAPIWLSRLRLHGPQLLTHLRRQGDRWQIREIRPRIMPSNHPGSRPQAERPSPRLSATAAAHLLTAASGLPASELREALLRLARRGANPSDN